MNLVDSLRQYRIGEYALFDFVASFVGMALLAPLLSWLFLKARIYIPKRNWIILTLPIGIVAHVLVGTITPMTQYFLDPSGHYLLKVAIIAMVIFGLRGIKIVKHEEKKQN